MYKEKIFKSILSMVTVIYICFIFFFISSCKTNDSIETDHLESTNKNDQNLVKNVSDEQIIYKKIWNAPPDTIITSGPSGDIDAKDVTIRWTGVDDQDDIDDLIFSFKLNNDGWSEFAHVLQHSINNLTPNTNYEFSVKARDSGGLIDPTPAVIRFFVKDIIVTLTGPLNGATVDRQVTFSWAIENSGGRQFSAEVCTDKGMDPFDGNNEDTFDAGVGKTSLTVLLDSSRYRGAHIYWGVRLKDGNNIYLSNIWEFNVK